VEGSVGLGSAPVGAGAQVWGAARGARRRLLPPPVDIDSYNGWWI